MKETYYLCPGCNKLYVQFFSRKYHFAYCGISKRVERHTRCGAAP